MPERIAGKWAFGATFQVGGSPLANIKAINLSGLTADDIDVSSHSSPNAYREYLKGMKDGGEVGIEGEFDPATASSIMEKFDSNEAEQCVITVENTCTVTFTAYCKEVSWEFPYEDSVEFSATWKITGKPEYQSLIDLNGEDGEGEEL